MAAQSWTDAFVGRLRIRQTQAGGPVQIETTKRGQAVLDVTSKPQGGRDCDTHIRALVVDKQGIALSSEKQEIRMVGADGPFDTPRFITLAATATPMHAGSSR